MEISIKHKGETLQEIKQGRVYSLTSLLKTHSLCLIILHRIWSYSIKWCLYFPLHAHKVRHYSCPWSKMKLLMSICLSLTTTHTHTAVMSAKEHIFIFKDFPRSWSPLTMKTCISAYTLCHAVPCVQLLLTYSCGTFFFPLVTAIPDVSVWVICLRVMPVLNPPTGHLTVYVWGICRAQTFTASMRATLRTKQEDIFSLSQNNSLFLVRYRLLKQFSGPPCEGLNRAAWEQMDKNMPH